MITPDTPLEELSIFFEKESFALVTDDSTSSPLSHYIITLSSFVRRAEFRTGRRNEG